MNKLPENTVYGKKVNHISDPCYLNREDFRYHMEIFSIPSEKRGDKVIMFTYGVSYTEGHDADVHDGLRSGKSAGKADMRNNYRCYSSIEDWVNAGNSLP